MSLKRRVKIGSSCLGKIGVFAETSTGHFTYFNSSDTTAEVSCSANTIRAVAVPIQNGYRCSAWYKPLTTDKEIGYNMLTMTAASGGTASYPRSVSDVYSAYSNLVIKDEHGTHYGTPSGTGLYEYSGMFIGVMHATTDAGYTFKGWRITADKDELQIKDPTSASPSTNYVVSAGGSLTSDSTTTTVEFMNGYAEAVIIQLCASSTYGITIEAVYDGSTPSTDLTITFNANGGSVSPTTKTYKIGDYFTDMPTPTKSSLPNKFVGWFTAASGGDAVTSSTKVTSSSPNTLYAHWEYTETYTCTYNANGGSGAPSPTTFYPGREWSVSTSEPAWDEFRTFAGWSTSSTATTPTYSPGQRIAADTFNSSVTFYAVWTYINVTVTLNANGGSFPGGGKDPPSPSITFVKRAGVDTYGSDLATPLRSGYYFLGWYDPSDNLVTAATLVSNTSNHTLTARWTNASSGYTPSYTTDTQSGGAAGMEVAMLLPDGCIAGHAPNITGLPAHVRLAARTDFMVVSAMSKWGRELASSIVLMRYMSTSYRGRTIDGNKANVDGSTVMISTTPNYGVSCDIHVSAGTAEYPYDNITLALKTSIGATYEPYGWILFRKIPWIKSGESIDDYLNHMPDGKFKRGPVVVLRRNEWLQPDPFDAATDSTSVLIVPLVRDKSFLVLFNPNGGEISGTSYFKRVYNGDTYGTLPTATQAGYSFAGWFTEETGGTQVTASTVFRGNTDQVLYAHWTKQTTYHTLTFDPAGGSVSTPTRSLAEGAAYGTLPTPTWSGHTFVGWFTLTIGGNQVSAATTMGDDDVRVYAHWQEPQVTVTFNPGSGTVDETSRTFRSGRQLQRPPTPYWEDHTFLGWFTDATGGTEVTASTVITSSCVVYAHWDNKSVVWWDVETW